MQVAGFFDAVEWEKVKKQTPEAIRQWINKQLEGTSVTVVLIGAKTSESQWVRYEIKESRRRGNALLGIYIHQLKDQYGKTDQKGKDPFAELGCPSVPIYDWVDDNGYANLGNWIEKVYDLMLSEKLREATRYLLTSKKQRK